ncbi:hypothetical protein FOZ60_004960 [Perkinsus olseni]|uniref:Uncharacterized protein n=1 Tax=Perkinsus olseni TaxID=32597 RepID=A0A7J6NUF0_PEROL|nr:hypothetical protein FOZ60_004960 [Perkinsus olseni]
MPCLPPPPPPPVTAVDVLEIILTGHITLLEPKECANIIIINKYINRNVMDEPAVWYGIAMQCKGLTILKGSAEECLAKTRGIFDWRGYLTDHISSSSTKNNKHTTKVRVWVHVCDSVAVAVYLPSGHRTNYDEVLSKLILTPSSCRLRYVTSQCEPFNRPGPVVKDIIIPDTHLLLELSIQDTTLLDGDDSSGRMWSLPPHHSYRHTSNTSSSRYSLLTRIGLAIARRTSNMNSRRRRLSLPTRGIGLRRHHHSGSSGLRRAASSLSLSSIITRRNSGNNQDYRTRRYVAPTSSSSDDVDDDDAELSPSSSSSNSTSRVMAAVLPSCMHSRQQQDGHDDDDDDEHHWLVGIDIVLPSSTTAATTTQREWMNVNRHDTLGDLADRIIHMLDDDTRIPLLPFIISHVMLAPIGSTTTTRRDYHHSSGVHDGMMMVIRDGMRDLRLLHDLKKGGGGSTMAAAAAAVIYREDATTVDLLSIPACSVDDDDDEDDDDGIITILKRGCGNDNNNSIMHYVCDDDYDDAGFYDDEDHDDDDSSNEDYDGHLLTSTNPNVASTNAPPGHRFSNNIHTAATAAPPNIIIPSSSLSSHATSDGVSDTTSDDDILLRSNVVLPAVDKKLLLSTRDTRQFEFHPTYDNILLTGHRSGNISIIDINNDECIARVKADDSPILGLTWFNHLPTTALYGASPTGNVGYVRYNHHHAAAAGYQDEGVIIKHCRTSTFKHLSSISINSTDDYFMTSGFVPDVALFDTTTGGMIGLLTDIHSHFINILRFANHSPHIFATSSFDHTFYLIQNVKGWVDVNQMRDYLGSGHTGFREKVGGE